MSNPISKARLRKLCKNWPDNYKYSFKEIIAISIIVFTGFTRNLAREFDTTELTVEYWSHGVSWPDFVEQDRIVYNILQLLNEGV